MMLLPEEVLPWSIVSRYLHCRAWTFIPPRRHEEAALDAEIFETIDARVQGDTTRPGPLFLKPRSSDRGRLWKKPALDHIKESHRAPDSKSQDKGKAKRLVD